MASAGLQQHPLTRKNRGGAKSNIHSRLIFPTTIKKIRNSKILRLKTKRAGFQKLWRDIWNPQARSGAGCKAKLALIPTEESRQTKIRCVNKKRQEVGGGAWQQEIARQSNATWRKRSSRWLKLPRTDLKSRFLDISVLINVGGG